ncbi:MAG: ABC transporter ATP-binding protein [Thermodesulfobacteriota bacterium]
MLEIIDLFFDYGSTKILEGIEARVEGRRILSVVGPNGAGKTTLLKCIVRILKPVRGSILIEDRDTTRMSRRELAKYLGYVPQNMPVKFPMTVFEMVLTGRKPYLSWRPSEKDLRITANILSEMNIEDLGMRDVEQLSGGQAQKVLLARALAQEPEYLLLDEPTSNLDLRHQLEVLGTIATLIKNKGIGAMMAMHDLNLAARFSDTILMLNEGKVFSIGTPSEVITPKNIREVYGVEVVVRRDNGYPHIQVLHCVIDRSDSK